MREPSDDGNKDNKVYFRASDDTVELIDHYTEEWGFDSRSETLRVMIHSHVGLMYGNFIALLDNDRLSDEMGDVGELIANARESDGGVPESLDRVQLKDIIVDIPILLGAAHEEVGIAPPDDHPPDE